ncbi:YitT family protein [Desulfobaculum senezii]
MNTRQKIKKKLELPLATRIRRFTFRNIMVLAGCAIAALGFVLFQVPYNITAGGISGLAIILSDTVGLSEGIVIWLVNIPLLMLGFVYLGRWRFLSSSIMAVFAFSAFVELFLNIMPGLLAPYPITHDKFLASLYAGVLFGLGSGIIFRFGSTIGGTSIPARIIHNFTGYPMSQVYLFTDLGVICLGGLVYNWEMALLALFSLVMNGLFSDFAMEGSSQLRTSIIITKKPEQVRYALVNEMQRGVTMWEVTGGYSKEVRTMLYCTVRRSRVSDLRFMISQIDPDALVVIGVVQQAWGGYGNLKLTDN